jgi:hypothetical protein
MGYGFPVNFHELFGDIPYGPPLGMNTGFFGFTPVEFIIIQKL